MNTNQQLYKDLMKRKCKQWWSTIPKVCFQVTIQTIMKAKFQMWWPTIPPISTKQTITCHLKSLNIKKNITYIKRWKSRSWFGQAPKCGWVKPVFPMWSLPIKNLHRFTSTQKDHILITKMNDMNMDSTIAGSVYARSYM